MSDIQKLLRAEISRLARREIRSEIDSLKKASAQQRSAIAELRRQVDLLQRQVKQLSKLSAKGAAEPAEANTESGGQPARRFSASRLAAHRAKLGLSAAAYGQLVGVSGQSIYNWEQGNARPRPAQLQALVAVRSKTRRDLNSASASSQ